MLEWQKLGKSGSGARTASGTKQASFMRYSQKMVLSGGASADVMDSMSLLMAFTAFIAVQRSSFRG